MDLAESLDSSQVGDPERRVELVTVLASGNPAELALAESLLAAEGIHYFKLGDRLQDLFGAGRLGVGSNLAIGPPTIQVAQEDADRARELLAPLRER